MLMKKLLFIVNPKAGKTAIKTDILDIIVTFSAAGYEVTTYPTAGPEDAEKKVIEDGAKYDLIVCAGGDGTLENTVCGYMQMGDKKVPIGYIPVGTTNDFARSVGLSRKPAEAAIQIVNGEKTTLDIGRLDDKFFVYIAAFGLFTDVSYSTNQNLKKYMGHAAYVVEAIKNITDFKGYNIKAQLDGALVTGEYIYVMITNSFSVAGFKIRGAKHVILDDGKFDCLLVKMPHTVDELRQVLTAFLSNDIDDTNSMFYSCKASKIIIECEEEIPWTIDGEFGGNKKVAVIENVKQAFDILLEPGYKESKDELAVTEDTSDDIFDSEDILDELDKSE